MTTNIASLLDKPSSEVEKPKPLPAGTYNCVVQGLPKFDKSSKKQTEYVEFTLKPVAHYDDVDQEALEAMGGYDEKTLPHTLYITDASLWRLKEFLDDCGAGDASMSLRERVGLTPNSSINVTLRHETAQNGKDVFARIGSTTAAD